MPLYEYECRSCGRRTEALQRMDDPPLTSCPECGGPLKKLISAPGFQFKGSGWYVTDYARQSGSSKSGGAAKEGEPAAKTAETPAKAETSAKPSAKAARFKPRTRLLISFIRAALPHGPT